MPDIAKWIQHSRIALHLYMRTFVFFTWNSKFFTWNSKYDQALTKKVNIANAMKKTYGFGNFQNKATELGKKSII